MTVADLRQAIGMMPMDDEVVVSVDDKIVVPTLIYRTALHPSLPPRLVTVIRCAS